MSEAKSKGGQPQGGGSGPASAAGKRIEIGIALIVTITGLLVYAAVTGMMPGGAIFGFVQSVELRSLDALFKSRGVRPPDPRIVIVGLDENTLRKLGQFPIPRNGYAKLVDKLAEGGAKVVAFDFAFPTPEKNSSIQALSDLEKGLGPRAPGELIAKIREIEATSDNDKIFAESMRKAGNVILGHSFLDAESAKTIPPQQQEDYYNILWGQPFSQALKVGNGSFTPTGAFAGAGGQVATGVFPNIGLLADAAKSYGFYDALTDADGTIRRAPVLVWYKDRDFFTSLPIKAVQYFQDISDQDTEARIGEQGLQSIKIGPHDFHASPDGSVFINYAGPYRTYPQFSMGDIIDGTVPPSTFKDKIVFVGATAKGIGDLRTTPFQSSEQGYMGVETHANIADNVLHTDEPARTFIHRGFNQEIIDLTTILFFGLGMSWAFARLKPIHSTISAVVTLFVYLLAARFAFAHFGVWLYVVVPTSTLLLDYGAITSYRMMFEEREKRKVRKTFSRYVSPGVIGLIEKDPKKYFKTGGDTKELSIMFSDIRSFTSISEGMTADELVLLLNEYLGAMTDILFQRWGTLDKYIGDALMAFWGSPYPQEDHYIRACGCALDMSKRLDEMNKVWESQGKKRLEIGIGINTGLVNVGNMGSDKRFAWTVMGDHVNLASRLEGQNKAYHTTRIISEFTWEKAKDQFVCRPLDRIRVKGKLKPVGIYELLAFKADEASYQDLLNLWYGAQNAYYRMAWDEAIQRFETLLARYPDDGPSHAFLKRSHEYRLTAPEPEWDGVYIAKEK